MESSIYSRSNTQSGCIFNYNANPVNLLRKIFIIPYRVSMFPMPSVYTHPQ